jgi:nitric-oxide synthase
MYLESEHQVEEENVITPSTRLLISEAKEFLTKYYSENNLPKSEFEDRLLTVTIDIIETGTYHQTIEELTFGAKVAWRNSTRCIGRIFWDTLIVRDYRHLTTAEEIFTAIVDHIEVATNGGNIKSMISIFAPQLPGKPGIRIWNPLLIRYAGYKRDDGSVIGDPDQIELTKICSRLGWSLKERYRRSASLSHFDILPLIIQMPDEMPKLFEIPKYKILEIPITHPDFEWFAGLGLKWHALPSVSDHRFENGGINYTAAPFNGWYMSSEIGSRNFGDENRCNLLPTIGKYLGLNMRSKLSLWKDRALIELNAAVLHSFAKHGVSVVDHHTASDQFIKHVERENKSGREVPADWGAIVPPISGSATKVFHREYKNEILKPNFFPQSKPWGGIALTGKCPFH